MRHVTALIAVLLALGAGTPSTIPNEDGTGGALGVPFRETDARPVVALHEIPRATDAPFLTVSGIVFSRSPIEGVSIGDRAAMIRPAEPEDLVRLERAPRGAAEFPFRTYFEVPDASLSESGENGLVVRAQTVDGRESNLHRVSVIRTTKKQAAK